MTEPVRIPADVDHPDIVLAGLTARQVAILGSAALGIYSGWLLTRPYLPILAYLALAAPVAVGAVAAALVRRNGISLDRHLVAALAYRLRPRQLTGPRPPQTGHPVPPWLLERADTLPLGPEHAAQFGAAQFGAAQFGAAQFGAVGALTEVRTGPLRLPARGVRDGAATGGPGILDLGAQGCAVLAVLGPVPFALRESAEQQALTDCFARLLLSADGPMQILVRALAPDLRPALAEIAHSAATLPHPALAAAAQRHHQHLADLAAHGQLLTRQFLLILREPTHTATHAHRALAGDRLTARLSDARRALAPAHIELTPLTPAAAETVLATATSTATSRATGPAAPQPAHPLRAATGGWPR